MRIGIITFHSSLNYGAVLQAYALSECLKSLGHEAFFIDYQPDFRTKQFQWSWAYCGLNLVNIIYPLLRKRFGEFTSEYLSVTSRQYRTIEELVADPPKADAYICGSDQIWNPDRSHLDPAYFLTFAPKGIRRIAYAASFGKKELKQAECHRIALYLKDFDHISVREANAVRIVNDASGKKAEHVLDPTLLVDNFNAVEIHRPLKDRYVLVVNLQNNSLLRRTADFVSRALQLPKVVVNNYSIKVWQLHGKRLFPGPASYLALFRNADYIVTNSFHGTAFSIVFNKPCIITSLSDNMNERNIRITGLLESTKLSKYFLEMFSESRIRKIMASALDLDWAPVRKRLHNLRQDSLRFLRESLS